MRNAQFDNRTNTYNVILTPVNLTTDRAGEMSY